jgi:multicomponent Na+:H+ antiporter subunit E
MIRYFSLAGLLFAFWLALSGHYTLFLLLAGAGCTVVCLLVAARIRIVDVEGQPVELFWRTVIYYPWLIREIAKSAWSVTKVILNPRLPISPTMTVVRASQKTMAGVATYANSITLTPGTITVGVSGTDLTVHALVRDGALDLEGGVMDRHVSRFEGSA